MTNTFDLIVIGAGASGLMAAGVAAEKGKKVLLLEKMDQPGRKLRITGKGRCNLTNICDVDEFQKHIGKNGRFLKAAFSSFFHQQLIQFFEEKNVKLAMERGSRVFPQSGKAQDIFFALIHWIEGMDVVLMRNSKVTKILTEQNGVRGVLLENGSIYYTSKIILATGGKSYPLTGSDGSGYKLAEEVGHSLTPLFPALVPINVIEEIPSSLNGLELKNVRLSVFENNQKIAEEFGDLSFTSKGITGPIVLTISRQITSKLNSRIALKAILDLKPALDHDKLEQRLLRDISELKSQPVQALFRRLMPMAFMNYFADRAQLNLRKPTFSLTAIDRKNIRMLLKEFSLTLWSTASWAEAIITQGGIPLSEMDSQTMESKKVKGLYVAGEILDLDADTGGYNLQIAFSTGYFAALNASF